MKLPKAALFSQDICRMSKASIIISCEEMVSLNKRV